MLRYMNDLANAAVGFLQPISLGALLGESEERVDNPWPDSVQAAVTERARSLGNNTWKKIQETQSKASRLITEGHPLEELQPLLKCCLNISDIINARDILGYNLLQYAIIAKRSEVVHYLVRQGADLNMPMCARPLHLAAKLGHVDIVRILLDFGADPHIRSCVCYPDKHSAGSMIMSDRNGWSGSCVGDLDINSEHSSFKLPLFYAIQSDSINCVRLLVSHGGWDPYKNILLLHTACSLGAFRCADYFLSVYPSQLHSQDSDGFYPLQHAVKWGKKITEYLVLKGACVSVKTNRRESLLVLLYKRDMPSVGLAETTSYLIDCGLRMMVNIVDAEGNSPLHMLMRNLHRSPPKWISPDVVKGGEDFQVENSFRILQAGISSLCMMSFPKGHEDAALEYSSSVTPCMQGYFRGVALSGEEREYLESLIILLRAGANTSLTNKVGNTCFHDLVRIPPPNGTASDGILHHCSLRLIYILLSVLFDHGMRPYLAHNTHGSVCATLIITGADAVFHQRDGESLNCADPTELHYLIKAIRLLSANGCHFGSECDGDLLLWRILTKFELISSVPHSQSEQSESKRFPIALSFASQLMELVEACVDSGLRHPKGFHELYAQLMNLRLILPSSFIKSSILSILHRGVDPCTKRLQRPDEPIASLLSVYPLLQILKLIGCLESCGLDGCDPELMDLFFILYNAMDGENSSVCLHVYLNRIATDSQKMLQKWVRTEISSPRRLRQITAQFIFTQLCQRMSTKVNRLPLPNTLKTLLLALQF